MIQNGIKMTYWHRLMLMEQSQLEILVFEHLLENGLLATWIEQRSIHGLTTYVLCFRQTRLI